MIPTEEQFAELTSALNRSVYFINDRLNYTKDSSFWKSTNHTTSENNMRIEFVKSLNTFNEDELSHMIGRSEL